MSNDRTPDLLGPYTEGSIYGALSQKFRETFPTGWRSTARRDQWVIGNDTLTVSYKANTREYAIIQYPVEDLIKQIEYFMETGQTITIPVLHVEYVNDHFKYPLLQIERMLKEHNLY